MKHRKIPGRAGNRNKSGLRRIRRRYMRRRLRKRARTRRLAFLCCAALAAGYLLILAEQGGRLLEIEEIQETEDAKRDGQPLQDEAEGKQKFGIIFRLKDGEITFYRESSY